MRSSLLLSVALTFGFLSLTFTACGTASKCSATTCPTGCCDTSGLCQTTGSASACGSRGSACAVCGVTASCVAGSCMQNISGSGGGTSGGEAATFCARLGSAMTRFFAGRSTCGSGGLTLSNNFNASACLAGYGSCSMFDKQALTMGTTCIEMATICSSGNDAAAVSSISSCLATISDISPTCAAAMGFGG